MRKRLNDQAGVAEVCLCSARYRSACSSDPDELLQAHDRLGTLYLRVGDTEQAKVGAALLCICPELYGCLTRSILVQAEFSAVKAVQKVTAAPPRPACSPRSLPRRSYWAKTRSAAKSSPTPKSAASQLRFGPRSRCLFFPASGRPALILVLMFHLQVLRAKSSGLL